MTLSDVTPIVVGLLALAGALWQGRRPRFDTRDRLRRDLDLLAAMPDDLAVKAAYAQHISEAFDDLIRQEDKLTRNMSAVFVDLSIASLGGWLTWLAWKEGGSFRELENDMRWGLTASLGHFLLVAGIVAALVHVRKRHRDEGGRTIVREDLPRSD
ncbi:hypothetical protein GR925_02510 [Streptomyces sp. HUCO-GS316]|uniref:hypothetical protein n=1 Tax=Streptomyces sp. HUCO-GS316 TaxID=2692198 RepID=UPI001367EC36|nr:hypothetical protein [Streptomyces sp. HUCO-GS316]MXM62347.1 hypothetical protein [Streptomyces sp. HUCO-GS316]